MPLPSNPLSSPAPSQSDTEALQEVRAALGRCENLLASPDFQWFLNECVGERLARSQETALNTKLTTEERNVAAHVRAAISEIHGWTLERRDTARETISTAKA